jgi:hypothetical protein
VKTLIKGSCGNIVTIRAEGYRVHGVPKQEINASVSFLCVFRTFFFVVIIATILFGGTTK